MSTPQQATRVIVPLAQYRLVCALGHEWDGTLEVVNRGIVRSEGRRARPRIEHVYNPHRCPTCGHQCMGGKPVAA